MIEAVDLSKRYPNGKLALDSLSFKVSPGEICCLLGPAGAGKSTTINLFLHFIEATAGKALIDGIDVSADPLAARRRAAYLGSDMGFYGELTARRNLEFFDRIGGGPRRRRDEYDQVLREMGLPEAAFGQRVRSFDAGFRQKLGFAAALLKGAPALLIDELLAGLDAKSAADLVEILDALRHRGRAILLATYDLLWAHQLADRVVILQEGRQVLSRSREELKREDLDELYLDYLRGEIRPR
jgi:ABC-2 type transport system ATP-binding protein